MFNGLFARPCNRFPLTAQAYIAPQTSYSMDSWSVASPCNQFAVAAQLGLLGFARRRKASFLEFTYGSLAFLGFDRICWILYGSQAALRRFFFILSTNLSCESMAYRSCRSEKCSARGVSKVTTGLIGVWQRSFHGDVSFWSFDVGCSYLWDAEVPECWFVHS